MDTNEPTAKPPRRKLRTPDLEPAYGELRQDYDHRRVQAELFQMVYFHARPSDIIDYLQEMHDAWLGSSDGAGSTPEQRRRCNAVVNDLCRLVGTVSKNVRQ